MKSEAACGGTAGGEGVCSETMELLMRQTRWKSCEHCLSELASDSGRVANVCFGNGDGVLVISDATI